MNAVIAPPPLVSFFTTYYIVEIYPMNNIYDAVTVFELA